MNAQPDNSREETYREARKQIVRSAFLALAALGVIVFACYAWFVSSGTVTGTVGSVRIDGSSFELASVGGDCRLDSNWSKAKQGEEQTIGTLKLVATGKESHIFWKISDTSHLENISKNSGISPGSFGNLEFYVIPKRDGELRLKCKVELTPLYYEEAKITTEDVETIEKLLKGHFQFSCSCPDAASYEEPILFNYISGDFPILTFKNAAKDQPILVTLGWKWPEFLRDVINNDKDGSTVKVWMSEQPNHFFYNGKDESGKTIQIPKPTFDNFTQQFGQYNNYYNNADQYIGDNVQSLVLRLTAEET